uniref:Uncharacterized protein n=1 Tax=Vespula pensylvanica TaxID=30213 RepID=A0A834NYL5_VESPE|nr:hypothetical protein H0235_009438 [Vespula pensylvanica]
MEPMLNAKTSSPCMTRLLSSRDVQENINKSEKYVRGEKMKSILAGRRVSTGPLMLRDGDVLIDRGQCIVLSLLHFRSKFRRVKDTYFNLVLVKISGLGNDIVENNKNGVVDNTLTHPVWSLTRSPKARVSASSEAYSPRSPRRLHEIPRRKG